VALFTEALAPALQGQVDAVRDLAARIDSIVDAARAAWPGIDVDDARFLAHLAERLGTDGRRDLDALLADVHGADLYLAAACVAGDARAIAAFEAAFAPVIRAAVKAMNLAAPLIDEVEQEVKRKLLLADGGRPKIGDYSGRAELSSWVRTTAVRTAISLLRKEKESHADDELLLAVPAASADPELEYLKRRYGEELRQSFREALLSLTPRQRTLLRYHALDGLTVDEIGAIYRVHRATAYRWIDKARADLLAATTRRLRDRLNASPSEVRSILRLVESGIELSLNRLMET
jgi:RNA polymerase sigma-70 factor (ECF subfamily)